MTKRRCCCRCAEGCMTRRKRRRRRKMTEGRTARLRPACSTRTCSCLTERTMPAKKKATILSPVRPLAVTIILKNKVIYKQGKLKKNISWLLYYVTLTDFVVCPLQPYTCQKAVATLTERWMCDLHLHGGLKTQLAWAWSRTRAWCHMKATDLMSLTWKTAMSGTASPGAKNSQIIGA